MEKLEYKFFMCALPMDEVDRRLQAAYDAMVEQAHAARSTAKKAGKAGHMARWDKYHAVARAYESSARKLLDVASPI
ncbi:MAG: hypothetical protein A4E69_00269 [Syntrophus sp. PtaB.Bin138]|nr:MAG: hypothetical protein A4E69_00269 [Syntrophus sp. PtaB.Bin138]